LEFFRLNNLDLFPITNLWAMMEQNLRRPNALPVDKNCQVSVNIEILGLLVLKLEATGQSDVIPTDKSAMCIVVFYRKQKHTCTSASM